MILGICGIARSGKDSVANMLAGHSSNPLLIQIAGPLKAYLRDLYDWTVEHTDGDLKDVPDERYPRDCYCVRGPYGENPRPGYRDVSIDIMGYNDGARWVPCSACKGKAVIYLTPRHAMQQLGGEFAESTFPAIYAVRAARAAAAHHGLAIITDCRFLRDIEAVKAAGGLIIETRRQAATAMLSPEAANHGSETARKSPEFQALVDHHIDNDGTFGDLASRVSEILGGVPVADPTVIVPGCWIESKRFGPAVCIDDRGDHYALRYKAERLSDRKTIWVGNTEGKVNCTLLRPADEVSRNVLTLTGPYGLGSDG